MWSHLPTPKELQNPFCFTWRHIELLRVVFAVKQRFCCSLSVVVGAAVVPTVVSGSVAAAVVFAAVVVVGLVPTLSDIAILCSCVALQSVL